MEAETLNPTKVQLAPELRELIVAALGDDLETAQAVSLTNRAWGVDARAHILKHKMERVFPRTPDYCAHLLAFMDKSPEIASFVRQFMVDGSEKWIVDDPSFRALCGRLVHVQQLTLHGLPPLRVAHQLAHVFGGATIRPTCLKVQNRSGTLHTIGNLSAYLLGLPTLVQVSLVGIEFLELDVDGNADYLVHNIGWTPAYDTSFQMPGVKSLTLSVIMCADVEHAATIAHQLAHTFPAVVALHARVIYKHDVPLFGQLLDNYGPQLETLSVDFSDWEDLVENPEEVEDLWSNYCLASQFSCS
jgi:hypothetical protein